MRLIPPGAKTIHTYRLRFSHMLLAAVAVVILSLAWHNLCSFQAQRAYDRVRKLEAYNRTLLQKVKVKEQEKKEMQYLADKRYKELNAQLHHKTQEIKTIWSLIGKHPQAFKAPRKSLAASRSGLSLNKIRHNYYALNQNLQNLELKDLKQAALSYHKQKAAELKRWRLGAIPSILPCSGYVSSGFGYRSDPFGGYASFHEGVDIIGDYGSGIYSAARGTVVYTGYKGGYGYSIEIDHGNGYRTFYAHCSDFKVTCGQTVSKGELIGYIGASGRATGSHVHYEVRYYGELVNPGKYF